MSDQRVALVTGAAGGIGAATVETLRRHGWSVLTTDQPGRGTDIDADLAEPTAANAIVNNVLLATGRLDLLVNNAAEMHYANLDADNLDQWWHTIEVNLSAPMRLARAALGALRAAEGQIINVSSVFGIRPEAGYSAYCASKAGLIGLTLALAIELAPAVRVNAIAPGHVDTPQQAVDAAAAGMTREELYAEYARTIPIGRVLDADEVARLIAFLAGERGYTGACIGLDGGYLLG